MAASDAQLEHDSGLEPLLHLPPVASIESSDEPKAGHSFAPSPDSYSATVSQPSLLSSLTGDRATGMAIVEGSLTPNSGDPLVLPIDEVSHASISPPLRDSMSLSLGDDVSVHHPIEDDLESLSTLTELSDEDGNPGNPSDVESEEPFDMDSLGADSISEAALSRSSKAASTKTATRTKGKAKGKTKTDGKKHRDVAEEDDTAKICWGTKCNIRFLRELLSSGFYSLKAEELDLIEETIHHRSVALKRKVVKRSLSSTYSQLRPSPKGAKKTCRQGFAAYL